MDIKISDNWLREYLKTKASAKQIADGLSLSGPSVEKLSRRGKDTIYDIEVTTNRVDCMSILGIAREGYSIFQDARLLKQEIKKIKNTNKNDLLHIKIDPKLVNRVMAIVMEVAENLETPKVMKERLENAGMRSLNPIVDITNYVMLEIGHPTHVFDYDLLKDKQIVFRPSDKNEEIISFDGKSYKLPGDDIVIDNGEGEIIDLPGIIGTKNSVVNKNTKRIVFFIDNNDPLRIRKTSTRLGIRTMAAVLNEKGVDPELATEAFARGIELYKKVCKANVISKVYDIYPASHFVRQKKQIKIAHEFIEKIIGVEIPSSKVIEILTKLGFEIKKENKKEIYIIKVPSWRASDIDIPEDIVEEVARIYGYHNLPSIIMTGKLPEQLLNTPFEFENKQRLFLFENKIKYILKGYGGVETYTLSLVPKEYTNDKALALKNPLGEDTKYLRTSLQPSLLDAVKENSGEKEEFYLFEIANIYIPRKNNLPEEKMMLGIVFSNYSYRKAKGIIEGLFQELNIPHNNFNLFVINDSPYLYFEMEVEKLRNEAKESPTYIPIPKYPAQIEDITFTFPPKTKVGEVIKVFERAELLYIFNDAYTFRIWYQDPEKTLTDEDVEKIREKNLKEIKEKFGGVVKS